MRSLPLEAKYINRETAAHLHAPAQPLVDTISGDYYTARP